MRRIRVKKTTFTITFEGSQYSPGVYLVTNDFVAKEPDCYVYREDGKRIEVKASGIVGVVSTYTAARLAENWPDFVSDVKPRSKAGAVKVPDAAEATEK